MCGIIISDLVIPEDYKFIKNRGPDYTNKVTYNNYNFIHFLLHLTGDKTYQPIINNNVAYIFNGEIYNYKYLRNILQGKGVKFKTDSDTEVLLESLIKWGKQALQKINGMFAFAFYDFNKQELILARDRFGIKPLYYCTTKNGKGIIFSSEIKTLIKTGVVDKEINLEAISSYLSFRYSYGVGNFFKKINKVEPGEILIFKKGKIDKKKYWSIPLIKNTKDAISEDKLLEELENILITVTKDHLESDVPVGSLLSGGLDSSLITSIMSNFQKKINTYSASFNKRYYDENRYALLVSKKINSNHKNITLDSKNYFLNLEKIIEHKYLPLNIPHEVALYELFGEIKSNNKVVISGEGADEMFGGYGRVQGSGFDFKKIKYLDYLSNIFGKKNTYNLFNTNKLFTDHKLTRKDHFYKIYNWFTIEQKQKILSSNVINKLNNDKKLEFFWDKQFDNIKLMDENNKFMYLFQKFHLQCLLDRLDLMSMAHGVEARVPFCDYRITEFLSTVPYKYKIKWKSLFSKINAIFSLSENYSEKLNDSKYLLRKLSKKFVPEQIANRDKLGFPVPLDSWITNKKDKNFIKDILLDDQTKNRGLFNIKEVENLINNKENLSYDFWGKKIWMLLNLEIWLRKIN